MHIPSLKENINIIINVRAETKDIRILCTHLETEDTVTIIKYGLKRMKIENFYRDTKQLGFGEYRFRKSEMALIHAHLVFLAYILLEILRHRLLWYRIAKTMPSIEFVITWVRKKTKQRFVRYICDKFKRFKALVLVLLFNEVFMKPLVSILYIPATLLRKDRFPVALASKIATP